MTLMTTRLLFVLTILLWVAIQCFVAQPSARAGDMSCSGLTGGGRTVTNIDGNVTVPDGKSCTLSFVNIKGDVRVGQNATLIVSAYTEPSEIGGNIEANNCNSVLLQGNVTVGGNLNINGCNGTASNGFQGPDVLIQGNFECLSNAGPCLAWLGTVDGNVQIQSNNAKGGSDVSLVSVGGNLDCQGNSPAVTHSHGPSWVDGRSQGQCAGFSTTTTSIATAVTPTPCANLKTLPASGFPVPNTVITSVDIPAGLFPGSPEFCSVQGYVNRHISPVDQCQYEDFFEVAMPINWNGRFFFQDIGGIGGTVPRASGITNANPGFGLINGYAVASEDGGHLNTELALPTCDSGYGNSHEFFLDPLATIGEAYQSAEVTTLVAKYLINQFYGVGPHHSYWAGCSNGGVHGMVMSQNFPSFFDGILAGDPGPDWEANLLSALYGVEQILNVYNANPSLPPLSYVPQPLPQPPAPVLYPAFPAVDQALLETALLQACDALDGVADGVIDNLPACKAKFDPATATYTSGGATFPLQCTGPKNATCLSPAQIRAAKKINQGPRNSAGQAIAAPAGAVAEDPVTNIVQGYAWDGGWMTTVGIPQLIGGPGMGLDLPNLSYGFLSPPRPTFNALDFNFDTDLRMLNPNAPIVTYSTSADIRRFVDYGHKIIWYNGLSDSTAPVLGTIKYYEEMAQRFGGLERAQQFSRFYPVPNMGHCGGPLGEGGAATDQFDLVTPLANWVENGTPPGPIPATGVNFTPATYQVSFVQGPTTRTRPLCPYPQQARFTGNVSVIGGVPIASNPADLADPTRYQCIAPPHLEERGNQE